MSTTTIRSPLRRHLLTAIEVFELALVATVGLPAIFAERMPPALLSVGLSLLVAPGLLRLLVGGSLTAPTLALWPLLLLVALSGLTVYVTPSWTHTWPELVRLLWGVALCLAVINWINPLQAPPVAVTHHRLPPRLLWATVAFFALGLALTAVGLLVMGPTQKFAWLDSWVAQLPQLPRADIRSFNPNRVAGVAVLLAPLALALALGRLLPRRPTPDAWLSWLLIKPLVISLALFFTGAVVLTQSRAAWLALGCAMLVILGLLGRRGWLLLAVLGVVAAAMLSVVGPSRLLQELTVYDPRQISPHALIQDRNLAGRLLLWQRALHGLADAPLTGMGLGAFEAVSQQPYPPLAGYQPDPDMSHVHNIVLQVGLDLGLPGLLAFLGLLLIMGRLLWGLVRRAPAPGALHTWSLGLVGSFVAYVVYNMLDALTLGARPSLVLWFLFGLTIGAGEWALAAPMQPVRHRQRVRTSAPAQPALPVDPQLRPVAPSAQEEWETRAWAATTGSNEE